MGISRVPVVSLGAVAAGIAGVVVDGAGRGEGRTAGAGSDVCGTGADDAGGALAISTLIDSTALKERGLVMPMRFLV
eukprot:CAMPEP_0175901940 /NCGR_PEP_ID=MMETSP0108-20121206/3130_1 /TAXON_ID=195067 ORGANISM="Goniomonas pacifica, Strain CCMP1869" /NCGR_SAMPLE_ID=MMETSP0108 /ASSEMBLY_ACC=CAM_ASM_000204 /LENGTH=76 /DNA_ID=CAMNT_0017223557 /DNA_START=505 /DNA_END=735 /DNA_ORIENTATION=+